jgi:hypothetical protein
MRSLIAYATIEARNWTVSGSIDIGHRARSLPTVPVCAGDEDRVKIATQ